MERIVTEPLVIDFHIHSESSKYKDDFDLVKDGVKENSDVLVQKLLKNGIQAFSITDHDYFSYDLYKKFKGYETNGKFKKVFPGVEFSVGFAADDGDVKQVHVICVFDDENDLNVKNIETVLKKNVVGKKINYDNGENLYFSESKFISILKEIGLSFVAIAHQKNSITSKHNNGEDLSNLGNNKFTELLQCEYFDALEFKNIHNGMFNKLFAQDFNVDYEYLRFITGSDCHEWSAYPKRDNTETNAEEFRPTYLKCLPSFRGLSMAFSDETRISSSNKFFTKSEKILKNIDLTINGENIKIPLSKGINVFIGDNSIGKSLLFHKLTNYSKLDSKKIRDGYDNYLKTKNISVLTNISNDFLYSFDHQGYIRETFNNNSQDNSAFLNEKFPPDLNGDGALSEINNEVEKLIKCMSDKFEYDKLLNKLCDIVIPDKKEKTKNISVTSITPVNKNDINKFTKIKNYFSSILLKVKGYETIDGLDNDDITLISDLISKLTEKVNKYDKLLNDANLAYALKTRINLGIVNFKNKEKAYKTDVEEAEEDYLENKQILATVIPDLLKSKRNIKDFEFAVEDKNIEPNVLEYANYKFVKRFKNYKKLSNEYLQNLVVSCLKNGSVFPKISEYSAKQLVEELKTTREVSEVTVLTAFKEEIGQKIKDDISSELAILDDSEVDLYGSLSSGMDSTIYFNIISDDKKEGIYMIDQPEDDVSQTRIKTSIIRDLKKMSQVRQVLLITHNPQFVVNLDADNVISFVKEDKNILIHSGALEYKDDKIDILDDVANGLEGGIDSIRKRWKRYDKRIGAK